MKIPKQYFHKALLVFLSSILLVTTGTLLPITASAVTGSDWQAGNIISDSVFYNSSAMNVSEIQGFLNDEIPTCDTNGTQIYSGTETRAQFSEANGVSPPFTCLNNYYENTTTLANNLNGAAIPSGAISAAQIIYNAAQQYGINPEVLIVLLQKEQSLVTDDWPWPIEYQEATGYGCPDGGSCSSQYYGFYNQVSKAAWQFQQYANSPTSYSYLAGTNNNILYSPNTSCGSSSVYIQNEATAGLYDYTPYQPDAAALVNVYASGDTCSSYGNRNFWRLFNDWFGSTQGGPISGNITRIYNPITQDYMLVLDNNQLTYEMNDENYWMDDGMVFTGYPSYAAGVVPVYELYNPGNGSHVYMLAGQEMNNAISLYGYTNNGVKFYAKTTQDGASRPVYRLSRNGKYFFTVSMPEVNYMVTQGYTNEGIVFYDQSNSTSAPVYRLSYKGIHFYTQNPAESTLAELGGDVYEGIAFNAQTAPTSDDTPVYRLVRNGHYIFTISRGERDTLVLMDGYQSQGAGFYAYPPGYATTTPIYGTDRVSPEDHLYTTSLLEAQNSVSLYGYSSDLTNVFNE